MARLACLLLLVSLTAACGGDSLFEPNADTDNDGIVDSLDVCPSEPENVNHIWDSDGCPDTPREFYVAVKDDIEVFWSTTFAAAQATYIPITTFTGYIFVAQFPCGLTVLNNAIYCMVDSGVYYDDLFLADMLARIGNAAPAFIIAHEIGHHVAFQIGLYPPFITIKQSELLADCAAGAWGQNVATRGLLEEGDLDELAATLMEIGDPAWTWFDPFMHGTPQQRALAFGVGFFGGPWACLSENQTPTAVIISPGQDTTITIGNAVDFQGTATDPDGAVLLHVWDFGDGATSTAEDPGLHTYASTGTYVARYIVSDNVGASSETDSVTIVVSLVLCRS